MKKFNLILLLAVGLFSGCNFGDLNSSTFIEDKNNPGLPEYSEWGYNTFGAYIDRSPYVSIYNDMPAKIIITADTFNLRFSGRWKGEPLTLKFSIKGYNPKNYLALTNLNDSTINLTAPNNKVTLIYLGKSQVLNVYEGELYFKRVQKLYVDTESTETILSGTFNMKTFIEDEPVAISNGRFDLGIGFDNFYKF